MKSPAERLARTRTLPDRTPWMREVEAILEELYEASPKRCTHPCHALDVLGRCPDCGEEL